MKQMLMIAAFLCDVGHLSQSAIGELRLTVTDPTCSRLKSTIDLVSQGNDYRNTLATDDQGNLDAKRLPFGIYQIRSAPGFADASESVDIRSALPLDRTIRLNIGSVSQSVKVSASDTWRSVPCRFGQ
jgi:hypothetical protein